MSIFSLRTLIDLALFALLHVAADLPNLPANTISYGAGIINNYLLHRGWTLLALSPPAHQSHLPVML